MKKKLRPLFVGVLALACAATTMAQTLSVTVDKKGRMGYMDVASHEIVIACNFQEAMPFNANGLAVVKKGSKYGLIDKQGNWVLKPSYTEIGTFIDGVAIVSQGKKKGLVSETGQVLSQPQYNFISDFNCYGVAWVNKGGKPNKDAIKKGSIFGGKWGVITKDGNERVACNLKSLYEFSQEEKDNNISGNDHWGVSTQGFRSSDTLVTDASYLVTTKGKFFFYGQASIIDGQGNVVMPAEKNTVNFYRPKAGKVCTYYKINKKETGLRYYVISLKQYLTVNGIDSTHKGGDFTEEIAPIFVKDGGTWKTLFMTANGKQSELYNSTAYHETSPENGVWIARTASTATLFNTKQEVLIPLGKYANIIMPDYSEDKFPGYPVKSIETGKWGVVTQDLREQIPFNYDYLLTSGDWFYAKNDKGLWGIIDNNGKVVMKPLFQNFAYNSKVKHPTVVWAQQEKNGTYQLYNIKSNKLYPNKYSQVYMFPGGYSWVQPADSTNLSKANENLVIKHVIPMEEKLYNSKGLARGIIVDNNDKTIFNTPITLFTRKNLDSPIADHAKQGASFTIFEERQLLLDYTHKQRTYPMEEVISEDNWDY